MPSKNRFRRGRVTFGGTFGGRKNYFCPIPILVRHGLRKCLRRSESAAANIIRRIEKSRCSPEDARFDQEFPRLFVGEDMLANDTPFVCRLLVSEKERSKRECRIPARCLLSLATGFRRARAGR